MTDENVPDASVWSQASPTMHQAVKAVGNMSQQQSRIACLGAMFARSLKTVVGRDALMPGIEFTNDFPSPESLGVTLRKLIARNFNQNIVLPAC